VRALGRATPGAETAARTVTVVVGDFSYAPATVTLRVGQRVRFVNRGKIGHTVAEVDTKGAILGRAIRPRLLETGESQVVTFMKPGRIPYLCTLHPTLMKGFVIIRR
jgi:plastocyanin